MTIVASGSVSTKAMMFLLVESLKRPQKLRKTASTKVTISDQLRSDIVEDRENCSESTWDKGVPTVEGVC